MLSALEQSKVTLYQFLAWLKREMVPTATAAVVSVSSVFIIAGAMIVLYGVTQSNPVREVSLAAVEPSNSILDRTKDEPLIIQRRICMSSAAEVRVVRQWIDTNGGIQPVVDDYAFLEAGCSLRQPVRVMPPTALNEGLHRYRVTLQWCNFLRLRCVDTHLTDVEVLLVGMPALAARLPNRDRF